MLKKKKPFECCLSPMFEGTTAVYPYKVLAVPNVKLIHGNRELLYKQGLSDSLLM